MKRILGRAFSDPWVQRLRPQLPFGLEAGREDELLVRLGRCAVEPEAVAELILRRVMACTEAAYRTSPLTAVIGVPTWFDAGACRALERAARRAGFLRIELVHEAMAAALAHPTCQDGLVAVVDLSASACATSILRIGPAGVVLISSAVDTAAGGDEVDRVMLQWVRQGLEERHGETREDPCVQESMRQACEWAKRDLLHHDTAVASVSYASVAWGVRQQRVRFHRPGIDALMRPIAARIEAVCERALRDAAAEAASLSAVYVVGGMAEASSFRAAIERTLGAITLSSVPATDAVALGTAVRAAVIDGVVDGLPLVDAREPEVEAEAEAEAREAEQAVIPDLEPDVVSYSSPAPPSDDEEEFEHHDAATSIYTAVLLQGAQQQSEAIPLEGQEDEQASRNTAPAHGAARDPAVESIDAICRHLAANESVPGRSIDVLSRRLRDVDHDGFVERAVYHVQRARSFVMRGVLLGYIERFVEGHESRVGPVLAMVGPEDALRLMGALQQQGTMPALRAVCFGLRSPFVAVRMQALACFAARDGSLDWQDLEGLVTDPDPHLRIQLLEFLLRRRFPEAGLCLARRIRSDDFHELGELERKLLLDALAFVSPKRAETYAIGILESKRVFASKEHNQSRAIAAEFLARSDTKEALEALERNAQGWFANAPVVRSTASRAARTVERRRSTLPPPPKAPS